MWRKKNNRCCSCHVYACKYLQKLSLTNINIQNYLSKQKHDSSSYKQNFTNTKLNIDNYWLQQVKTLNMSYSPCPRQFRKTRRIWHWANSTIWPAGTFSQTHFTLIHKSIHTHFHDTVWLDSLPSHIWYKRICKYVVLFIKNTKEHTHMHLYTQKHTYFYLFRAVDPRLVHYIITNQNVQHIFSHSVIRLTITSKIRLWSKKF